MLHFLFDAKFSSFIYIQGVRYQFDSIEIKARIKAVFAAIPRDMVVRACARFRKRVQAAIDAEGVLRIKNAANMVSYTL